MKSSAPTRCASIAITAALATALFAPQVHAADAIDPVETRRALTALLAVNDPIPRTSLCHETYGRRGSTTVKELLAMRMAYLYDGYNVIEGHCQQAHCTVTIRHAAGEDVASATLQFAVETRQGAGRIASVLDHAIAQKYLALRSAVINV